MLISAFIGTSVDGFIARPDGSFDFLDAGGNVPHGYEEFIATVDTHLIGRKTYETVRSFPGWAYGKKRVVVLSSKSLDFSDLKDATVEQMSGPSEKIVATLKSQGAQHVYIDGGITIQNFLRAGQIHRIIVSRVPILIGQGIPLFGTLAQDIPLKHISTKHFATGLVQTEYQVQNPATAQ
jgi:dihydrofolate reductase